MEGRGKYYYASGSSYDGQWKNNFKYGEGIHIDKNSKKNVVVDYEAGDPTGQKIQEFANIIHKNTCCEIREDQQNFVNKIFEALRKYHRNKNTDINIKELRDLLDKALRANHISYVEINKLQEVDTDISLKNKALDEINLNKLLLGMNAKLIDAIESKNNEKVAEWATNFSNMEGKINTIRYKHAEAGNKFIDKYNISPFPEDSLIKK